MSKKGEMPDFVTIDDYISSQQVWSQNVLKELRRLIKVAVPDAIEVPNYKVPTFIIIPEAKINYQIMMVAYSKFVSLYLFPTTLERFKDELVDFKIGKGTVSFPFDKQLPEDLIIRMVKFRKDEILKDLK
jgi:uncharacterized protein YdhG (YjbR/CyaY superfamily)